MNSTGDEKRALAIRLRGGETVLVPPSLGVTTTYVLLEQEAWFEDEVAFVRRCVRPGDCAIDIGANFGVYTTALAAAVGPTGKILAFEPATRTAEYLRATAGLGHAAHIEVVVAAVSDRAGRALFQLGPTPEQGALAGPGMEAAAKGTEMVDVVALDEFLSRRGDGRSVAFIKLDAEGHELPAGRGAQGIIARDEPLLLFEIKHGEAAEFGFLDFLETLGFSPYRLVPGPNVLVPFSRTEALDGKQLNLFGCSPRRAADLERRGVLVSSPSSEEAPSPAGDSMPPACYPFGAPPASGSAYANALAHFSAAEQLGQPPRRRLAHLTRALQQAALARSERDSLARRVTFARLAAELGQRTAATDLLRSSIQDLTQPHFIPPDEPCLAPSRRFEPIPAGPSAEALRIAVLETYERLRAFSSLFASPKSIPYLEFICQHPASSPEMHRRRQLMRLRHGLQARPEPHPKLRLASPDNLNPGLWQGGD